MDEGLTRFLLGDGEDERGENDVGDGVKSTDGIRVCVFAELTVPNSTKTLWNLAKSTDPSPVAGSHPGVA